MLVEYDPESVDQEEPMLPDAAEVEANVVLKLPLACCDAGGGAAKARGKKPNNAIKNKINKRLFSKTHS